jgi:hypothetical protein
MPAEIPKTISGDINLTTSSKIGLNLAPFPKIINSGVTTLGLNLYK